MIEEGKEMKAIAVRLTEEMSTKVDEKEVLKIHDHLGRFALYEDYKGLYSMVVPPVAQAQKNIEVYSKQLTQFEAILQRYDENMQLRAYKTDISGILNTLKSYVKIRVFEENV